MVVRLDALTGVIHGPTKHFEGGEQELAFLPAQWQRYLGQVHLFHDQAAISGLLYLSNRLGMTCPKPNGVIACRWAVMGLWACWITTLASTNSCPGPTNR
jgi:hypothetical protein